MIRGGEWECFILADSLSVFLFVYWCNSLFAPQTTAIAGQCFDCGGNLDDEEEEMRYEKAVDSGLASEVLEVRILTCLQIKGLCIPLLPSLHPLMCFFFLFVCFFFVTQPSMSRKLTLICPKAKNWFTSLLKKKIRIQTPCLMFADNMTIVLLWCWKGLPSGGWWWAC